MTNTIVEEYKAQLESKVMVYEVVLTSDILNAHFAENLVIDIDHLPPPDKGINYELNVDFSYKRTEDEAQIKAFPLDDKPYVNNGNYSRIGSVLSRQLKNIESRFIALGYDVFHCSINGEEFEEDNKVTIKLFRGKPKEFDKKGKPKGMRSHVIVPSVPGSRKVIAEAFADIARERQIKQLLEDRVREKHIPNNVGVQDLFELIASGVFQEQPISKESREIRIREAAAKWMACFSVENEWPLEMSGHIGEISKGDCTVQLVDCSEWMVFSQDKEGKWSLKAFESADVARTAVEKDIVNKSTDTIVVLHNLLPVSFVLMAHDRFGLSLIEKGDAPRHKRVQVAWRNAV